MGTWGVGRGIVREIDGGIAGIYAREIVREKRGESVNRRGLREKKGWGNMSEE